MLDKVLRIVKLFDFYGALLTDKQRLSIEMHYLHDFSLAEIADELGVSRQAVHDILKRAEQILFEYEDKLKFVERYEREQQALEHVYKRLISLSEHIDSIAELDLAIKELHCLLDYSKEV